MKQKITSGTDTSGEKQSTVAAVAESKTITKEAVALSKKASKIAKLANRQTEKASKHLVKVQLELAKYNSLVNYIHNLQEKGPY